jgi:hypothetical protein
LRGCANRLSACNDDDIDFELNKFDNEAWEKVRPSMGITVLNPNVFAIYVTEISQSLPERIGQWIGISRARGKPAL